MIRIRPAALRDAAMISGLLVESTREHIAIDCAPLALEKLLSSMSVDSVCRKLTGGYAAWIAIDGTTLVGACVLRSPSHLYHLFVAKDFHKRGIGRRLVENAVQYCLDNTPDVPALTLNASSFALPAYLRMGFLLDGPRKLENGVRYQPMRLPLGDRKRQANTEW